MKDVCAEYQTKEHKHLKFDELLEKFSKLVGQHPFKSKKLVFYSCLSTLSFSLSMKLQPEFSPKNVGCN